MPAALTTREEVVSRLLALFRQDGFDGVSLTSISRATGLGRSSLYHHFPGGKREMALAVLDRLDEWFAQAVVAPLRTERSPARRIDTMLDAIDAFYDGGRAACLLERLVASAEHAAFAPHVTKRFTGWTGMLADVLVDAGIDEDLARERAEDAVARIEGALILAAGLGSTAVFARTIRNLRAHLLDPPA